MNSIAIAPRVQSAADVRPALAALVDCLLDRLYDGKAIVRILDHVRAGEPLCTCTTLMPEDEAACETAFVDGLPPVPFDDVEAWGSSEDDLDDLDVPPTDDDYRPTYTGDVFNPTPEDEEAWRRYTATIEARSLGIMPIAGGAPDDDDQADAMGRDRLLDELAAEREAEDRLAGNPWF